MKTKLRPGWVLALLCTVLFFYGFYLGGVQLVISEVSREYGQNAAGMGGLVAAQHVAAVVLPVVLGALADRIGKSRCCVSSRRFSPRAAFWRDFLKISACM